LETVSRNQTAAADVCRRSRGPQHRRRPLLSVARTATAHAAGSRADRERVWQPASLWRSCRYNMYHPGDRLCARRMSGTDADASLYHGHTCCACADATCTDFAWVEVEPVCPLGCQTFMDAECEVPCHGGGLSGPAICVSITPCTSDADCDDGNGCTVDRCTTKRVPLRRSDRSPNLQTPSSPRSSPAPTPV